MTLNDTHTYIYTHTHSYIQHTHTHSHTHLVGLLWARDRPVRGLYTTNSRHSKETNMPAAEFEPAFPASKQPQAYALDHAATGGQRKQSHEEENSRFLHYHPHSTLNSSLSRTLYSANSSENDGNNDFCI